MEDLEELDSDSRDDYELDDKVNDIDKNIENKEGLNSSLKSLSSSSNQKSLPLAQISLYDCIAKRVNYEGLKKISVLPNNINVRSLKSLPPDEVLTRFKNAPSEIQYFESPDLPSSELIDALHYYCSYFWSEKYIDEDTGKWIKGFHTRFRFLDETALITLGILVEEYVKFICGDDLNKNFLQI